MADENPGSSREQRLAAKLRENLHRRKAQARALDSTGDSTGDSTEDSAEESAPGPATLSKTPPKS